MVQPEYHHYRYSYPILKFTELEMVRESRLVLKLRLVVSVLVINE